MALSAFLLIYGQGFVIRTPCCRKHLYSMLLLTLLKQTLKEDQIALYDGSSISKAVKTNTTSDTLSVFVFHIDTLLNHSWKEIRDGYKILVRYDLSAKDLESLRGEIYYPPTMAMRNIKMFPPYEKVKAQ